MNDTKTPAVIVYTTDDAGDGHAELLGNSHRLMWDHNTGNVTLDDQSRPCGLHLSERAWRTFAESLFHVPHDVSGVPAAVIAWRAQAGVS